MEGDELRQRVKSHMDEGRAGRAQGRREKLLLGCKAISLQVLTEGLLGREAMEGPGRGQRDPPPVTSRSVLECCVMLGKGDV